MTSLQEWENRLRPYLRKVELLSEIPLAPEEHAELRAMIGMLVKTYGLRKATRYLCKRYPAAFVVYLAYEAALNDESSFWRKVAGACGMQDTAPFFRPSHHWGEIFQEIMRKVPNLSYFSNVGGLKYVTPIRLHGGIPVYSLPDFFHHILLPSVQKAPFSGMGDEEALEALLARSATEYFADDIVRNFLKHAGKTALTFFSKCRRMARMAHENRLLPGADELGLGVHVVQAFENYLQHPPEPARRRRLPRLYFDAYQPAFRVVLPPQPLSLEEASRQPLLARLTQIDGAILAEKRVRCLKSGQDWLSEDIEWKVEDPLPAIKIELFAGNQENPLYRYTVRLLPGEGYPPLLAFRYEDNLAHRIDRLLARAFWLLYPADAELHFEGRGQLLETPQPFPLSWESWQANAWDLKNARFVRLLRSGQDICPPVPVTESSDPELVGGTVHPQSLLVEEKQLFSSPPRLRLPLRDPERINAELDECELCLESDYAAQPAGKWQGKASELPYSLLKETCALVELAPWLGQEPAGTYRLTIRRDGRAPFELSFRICHGLEIEGLQEYYLPESRGAQEVQFRLRIPEAYHLRAEEDITVERADAAGIWRVTVPPDVTQANLSVEIPTLSETVRIPLRLAVPRLRWALLLKPDEALEWKQQVFNCRLAELLQVDLAKSRPRLRVELPAVCKEKPTMALHLFVPEYQTPLQSSPSVELSHRGNVFDLSHYFDTLRSHLEESVFEFRLEFPDTKNNQPTQLPVLRLVRPLDIRVCHMDARSGGARRLHWYEPQPLRHRRLWLWSRWQPWSKPVEIQLPDNAAPSDSITQEGWWMYDIPDEFGLPSSQYFAQFVAFAPYDQTVIPRFPPRDALLIDLIDPKLRLRQIEGQLKSQPHRSSEFALHFERLCIFHSNNQLEAVETEIQWCLSHWSQANLLHLEALQRWLGEYHHDPNMRRAFLMHLFNEKSLRQLRKYPKDFVEEYLANLPEARTINPESARLILEMTHNPQVILCALQSLMRLQDEQARQCFWQALKERRFSEADAAQVLAQHRDFACELVREAPPSPLRKRLVYELGRHCAFPELLVAPECYILFDAGWGKITEIQGAEHADCFFVGDESPTLIIHLLHMPVQKVIVDLSNRQISLVERNGAYRCGCGRFISLGGKKYEALWQKHSKVCPKTNQRVAIPGSVAMQQIPVYRAAQPENPFDTRTD